MVLAIWGPRRDGLGIDLAFAISLYKVATQDLNPEHGPYQVQALYH